jgi:uncharacterized protein
MAQPNVAREPSMEEILASIRRIIESNDPGSDAAVLEGDTSEFEDDEIESFDEPVAFAPDLAANDAGLPRRPDFAPRLEPVMAPATAEKSLSLADVAARVRAASARHQDMAAGRSSTASETAPSLAREPVSVAAEPVTQAAFAEPSASVIPLQLPELRPSFADVAVAQPVATAEIETEDASEPVRHSFGATTAQEFAASEPAKLEPVEAQHQSAPVTTTSEVAPAGNSLAAMAGLLSEAAGAQVAKSFGELADVFDGLERRSVEEMAQDMLRPMLQEWLDDNLPTLVERLVREEIERVARGPRR